MNTSNEWEREVSGETDLFWQVINKNLTPEVQQFIKYYIRNLLSQEIAEAYRSGFEAGKKEVVKMINERRASILVASKITDFGEVYDQALNDILKAISNDK
jgi:hypothetical protein